MAKDAFRGGGAITEAGLVRAAFAVIKRRGAVPDESLANILDSGVKAIEMMAQCAFFELLSCLWSEQAHGRQVAVHLSNVATDTFLALEGHLLALNLEPSDDRGVILDRSADMIVEVDRLLVAFLVALIDYPESDYPEIQEELVDRLQQLGLKVPSVSAVIH